MIKASKLLEHKLIDQELMTDDTLTNLMEHGGAIKDVADKVKNKIIDFSSNLNPFGPPGNVIKAVKKSINLIAVYPDNSYSELVRKIAEYNGVDENQIIVGNGSAELFFLAAIFFKPRKTLLFKPTFSEYIRAILSVNSKIGWLNLRINNDIKLDFKELTDEIVKYDLAIIGNPNNPTGTILSEDQLVSLMEKAKKHSTFVLIDEAFIDFVEKKENSISACKYISKYNNLAIVRSLTKIFSIPGLRLGYLIANENVVEQMQKLRPAWMVNSLAISAGIAALDEKDFIIISRLKLVKLKEELASKLSSIGLKIYKSEANFLLVKFKTKGIKSFELKNRLLNKGFLIRDCNSFGLGDDFIRVAVRKHKENLLFVKALKEVLEDK